MKLLAIGAIVFLAAATAPGTFAQEGDRAAETLTHVFYAGNGLWRDCNLRSCHTENQDWGVDSATYTLYLRWKITHDPAIPGLASSLVRTATVYPAPCKSLPCDSWSDVPEWDTIALVRDYEIARNPLALTRAKRAFAFIEHAGVFARGACPSIEYQKPGGGKNYLLKTLETDANYIKAALLLYRETRDAAYVRSAQAKYAAVRRYFLDPRVALYSVYVYDDGKHCTQLPHRFFASVNGDMIWSGLVLANATGRSAYRSQAFATARDVDRFMSDSRGIFAGMQAENDVEEPLVEAMYDLAQQHQAFARSWILRNAAAALSDRASDGTFGRFFDGPAPQSPSVSVWQSNGGLALEIAAAGLAPRAVPATSAWSGAHFVAHRVTSFPASLSFYGSSIALIGTMGERCCEPGHARVFVDGVETFDRTGIWQNKSMTGSVPNSILFAWRWPRAGRHTIRIEPGVRNAKEGGAYIDLRGYIASAR
jgi:hypothetical protein